MMERQSILFKNAKGVSLVQVMVTLAVSMTLLSGIIATISWVYKESRALRESIGLNDLIRTTSAVISSGERCDLLFTKPGNVSNPNRLVFDPTSLPHSIKLNAIPTSMKADLTLTSGIARSLRLKNNGISLVVTSSNSAMLRLELDGRSLVRPLKDPEFPVILTVEPVGPRLRITGCSTPDKSSCEVVYPDVVEKITCGISGVAKCPKGKTLAMGGGTFVRNIALQNSFPLIDEYSKQMIGYKTTYLVTPSGPQTCANFNQTGTGNITQGTSSGEDPCFHISGSDDVCGGTMAVCCD